MINSIGTAPAISVVMAVYNGASWLPETLASLQAQTLRDWELIAVDDCSSDDSIAVLEAAADQRIRILRSARNGGPVAARNMAFAQARGRYVAGLDQDDISLPARFARQVAYLDAHPGVVLVSTVSEYLIDGRRVPGHWPRPLTPPLIDWFIRIRNPIVWSSVMFRADAARQLEPFERPEMRYVEDFDLYHRIRRFGTLAQIDEVLTLYRYHSGGASNRFKAILRENTRALFRERHPEVARSIPDIAALLVDHVMAGEPVPDIATLKALLAGIDLLRMQFGEAHDDPQDLAAVDRSIAELRWQLGRTGLRCGTLSLPRLRRLFTSIPASRVADLLVSQIIGSFRAALLYRGR